MPSAARDHQAGLVRLHHEVGSLLRSQLGQDAAHVRLGSEEADVQAVRDLRVREALRDQPERLGLAFGELVERDRGTRS